MINIKLTENDKMILASYVPIVEGLASYLSGCYEFVLHSLENLEHSAICVINGEHTGRKVGAPITDLALRMLDEIEKIDRDHIVYFSKNKKNEPLKSTTIAIRGEKNRIIGLLCINLYMNTPIIDMISAFVPTMLHTGINVSEDFSQNTDELIQSIYTQEKNSVMADDSILPSNKNKVIIERMYEQGLFKLKDSVLKIEDLMNISKNTIYLHIRNYKKRKA